MSSQADVAQGVAATLTKILEPDKSLLRCDACHHLNQQYMQNPPLLTKYTQTKLASIKICA